MLPDLKFLVCGLLFCIALFVAAGAITLPESPIHVGEMPDIARPMMQESITVPPPVPVIAMMVTPRSDESGDADPDAAAMSDRGTSGRGGEGSPSESSSESSFESSSPAQFPGGESAAAPVAGLPSTRFSGTETSGAGPVRPQGPVDDPLKVLIDSLPRADQDRVPVADAAPGTSAEDAATLPIVRYRAARLPGGKAPRRTARGRRHVPSVVQHHSVSSDAEVAR